MSEEWRIKRECEKLGRDAAAREQQRRDKEAALKREKEQESIKAKMRAEVYKYIEAKKEAHKKKKEEEEKAERLRFKQLEEKERLEAVEQAARLQERKEIEEARRKKENGWAENELELLQKLKKLRSPSGSEETTASISVADLEDTARLLHQNSISLNGINDESSAFYWAVTSGNRLLAQLLAENDEFRVKFQNAETDPHSSHLTTLQTAAQLGHLEIVNLILDYLPQVIDPDSNDLALILAIHNGHREVVTKLLGHHPMPLDFRYSGPKGRTVIEAAFKQGWSDIVQHIIGRYNISPDRSVVGARNKTALLLAAERGYTKMVETFLSSSTDIDPNVEDSAGSTPLLKAVKHGHLEVVELLLANPRIEINQKDKYGNTALLTALEKGQLPLAQLFLDRSDLRANAVNGKGMTALMMAASLGCSLSISKLLRHPDIDVHHRTQATEVLWGSLPVQKEWSALEIACVKGFRYIEHLLSTFLPVVGTQHKPADPGRWSPAIAYPASTSSSTCTLPYQASTSSGTYTVPYLGYTSSNTYTASYPGYTSSNTYTAPYPASTSSGTYNLPGSTFQEGFPSAPTHDFVHSRTELEAYEMRRGSSYDEEESGHGVRYSDMQLHETKDRAHENELQAHDENEYKHATLDTSLEACNEERGSDSGFDDTTSKVLESSEQYTIRSGRKSRVRSARKSKKISENPSVWNTAADYASSVTTKESSDEHDLDMSINVPNDDFHAMDLKSSYGQDLDCESKSKIKSVEKPVGNDASTSRDNDHHMGCSYSFSNFSTTVQSAVSFSVKSSGSLSHTQSAISNFFAGPATDTMNDVGKSSLGAEAYSAISARTTEALPTTVSQNMLHGSGSVSTSDEINWVIAAPATVFALLSVGLGGSALKLQKDGVESQTRMNLTLERMKEEVISISKVIHSTQSLLISRSGDPSSNPPPDLPTLLPEHIPIVRCLAEIAGKSLTQSASSQETPSLDFDSRSGYTSEDHPPDESDPTNSMKLAPSNQTRDQISSESQVGPVTENEAPDIIAIPNPEINRLATHLASQDSAKWEQQRIEDEGALRREEEQAVIQVEVERELIGIFELSDEEIDLFNNLHEEMSDFDFMDFDFGES